MKKNMKLEYMKQMALYNKHFLENEISKTNDSLKIGYLKGMLNETENELVLIDVLNELPYSKLKKSLKGIGLINDYVKETES